MSTRSKGRAGIWTADAFCHRSPERRKHLNYPELQIEAGYPLGARTEAVFAHRFFPPSLSKENGAVAGNIFPTGRSEGGATVQAARLYHVTSPCLSYLGGIL